MYLPRIFFPVNKNKYFIKRQVKKSECSSNVNNNGKEIEAFNHFKTWVSQKQYFGKM